MTTSSSTNACKTLLLVSVLFFSGCTAVRQPEAIPQRLTAANTAPFGERPAIPTPDDLHGLDAAQVSAFLGYMNQPHLAALDPDLRLYQYLENITQRYAYEGITHTAQDALRYNSGNCMSLAVLTTALVEAAGMVIEYQLMDDVPVYEFNDTLVKKGVHIRTKIMPAQPDEEEGERRYTGKGRIIDYFPTNRQRFIGNISRDEYLAMVYQNLAAEALERQDLNYAYWSALAALDFVPDQAGAINLLAVTLRRAGDIDTAELVYRFGIEHARDRLTLLKNYAMLLQENGRTGEARAIQGRLDRLEDPSPFHWYQLAQNSFDDGRYREAIRFYNKALDLAPYLHEAWLGIAQSNYELGRMDRTRTALVAALTEADKVSTRNLYEAKLVMLDRETGPARGNQ